MDLRFQFLVCMLAGWLNRQQQAVIDYQREEISVLLEQNGGKPGAFTDSQRRRLAEKASALGRQELDELAQLARPETLRKWLRTLVREKWTFQSETRKGRPPLEAETEELIIKLLKENPSWGSDRVVGALKNLGIKVSDTTIDNVRKRHGIPPAPEREKKVNWSKFLSAHWDGLLAADFFTTEVLCRSGLVTYYTLFVIELKTRLVHICGSTPNPDGDWMLQIARNLTDFEAGFAVGKSHLIIDRDTKYTKKFKKLLDDSGIEIVLCPPRAPRCNAFAERFVKSIKFECLNELILLGRRHLEVSIEKYTSFYNQFRNHQGVDNELLTPREFVKDGPIECQSELGGMLNFYYRKAA
jgi:putative transposase